MASDRAIAKANPGLAGVIDTVDYGETRNGEREIDDDALAKLVEIVGNPRYGADCEAHAGVAAVVNWGAKPVTSCV